jgi:isopenicillin-N N-acyltransferase like protein
LELAIQRSALWKIVLLGCLVLAAANLGAVESSEHSLGSTKLRVLDLEGTPRNRGLIHGRTMKEQIHRIVALWKAELAGAFKTDADRFIAELIRRTDFVSAMSKWTPELLEEIRGLAEGAEIDFETALALQLPDECFVHGASIVGEHCSSLGLSKNAVGPTIIAQNMDTPPFADGFQLVLHVKDANLESFVLTQAGCIGLNGMNSRAIAICCNSLWQLNGSRDGLPVACIVRGVLQQRSEEDAIAFLRKVKHASGQNYVIGGPTRAMSFECSAGRVDQFKPNGRDDVVWHTNHPLANNDFIPAYRALRQQPNEQAKSEANTRARLACLEKHLTERGAVRNVDVIKATLSARDSADYPVSRPRKPNSAVFTFASTIMVLSERPEMHIAPGPPDSMPYELLSFNLAAN